MFASDLRGVDTPADGQFIWEWWYQFQVTDNIRITPALFYLPRPMGELTPGGSSFQQLGGLIKTTLCSELRILLLDPSSTKADRCHRLVCLRSFAVFCLC